jgi:5,10-methylenetetrahydromethanopterin reductase
VGDNRAEVGLGIQGDQPPGRYADLAEAAETFGFDVLSVFGDLLYLPPLPILLEMAAATSRIRLGAACYNPYTLHPYEIAGQVAALDGVSAGRAYLGLARGTWLGGIGVAQARPVAHLAGAVALVRALLTGDDGGIESDIFPLAPGLRLRYPLPARLPSILLGTWGPATAALAGRVADEVKIGGTANPAMVPVLRERIAVGTRAAGRPDDAVGIVVGAVTVVDSDGAAARARARREVAMYLAVVAELDPTAAVDPELIDRVRRLVAAGDDAAAGALVPDAVLDLFAFAGTPEHVAEQAQRVLDAGAARVEFGGPHGLTPTSGVRLLGERVLPRLTLS